MTERDPLTWLASRERFEQRLEASLRDSACSPAVLLIDLDRFDQLTESLGAEAAEAVVREVARIAPAALDSPYMLTRSGGGEFTMLLLDCDRAAATRAAGALLDSLERGIVHAGRSLPLTASIGIAVAGGADGDARTLIARASIARDLLRAQGGAAYRFHDDARELASEERLQLEAALRRALVDGQYTLRYSPIVDAASGEIAGAEALVRWNSPDNGLAPPNAFLPLLEESGQIIEVGEWILHEAARQARAWHDAGQRDVGQRDASRGGLTVAVNVSATAIREGDLPATISRALDAAALPPHLLEIEVSETAALDDLDRTIETLNRIRALGVGIALDQFGTGRSSVTHLRQLPAQTVKIDRSFIRGVAENAADRAIVAEFASLARSLGRNVLAVGVETEAQREALSEIGCDRMQGFLFGRPRPAEDFSWLLSNRLSMAGRAA